MASQASGCRSFMIEEKQARNPWAQWTPPKPHRFKSPTRVPRAIGAASGGVLGKDVRAPARTAAGPRRWRRPVAVAESHARGPTSCGWPGCATAGRSPSRPSNSSHRAPRTSFEPAGGQGQEAQRQLGDRRARRSSSGAAWPGDRQVGEGRHGLAVDDGASAPRRWPPDRSPDAAGDGVDEHGRGPLAHPVAGLELALLLDLRKAASIMRRSDLADRQGAQAREELAFERASTSAAWEATQRGVERACQSRAMASKSCLRRPLAARSWPRDPCPRADAGGPGPEVAGGGQGDFGIRPEA